MLQWKASNGLSNTAFDELLLIVKDMLPEGNELSASTYEAKSVVCPLGLEVEKIHACPNDCILYQGKEYEKLDACPVCESQCYKISQDDPCDVEVVVWYFPVIPRLKHLFRCKANAKMMHWHKECIKDEKIRHPADGSQWRLIDKEFPEFADDARNIQFGLSMDSIHLVNLVVVIALGLLPYVCSTFLPGCA
jgi:hypothetical protein